MSKLIKSLIETAQDLEVNSVTIKEIESLNLPGVKVMKPTQIKKMRTKEKVSQAVMARILNVTTSTYQKWERGEIQPKGANLKLLRLAYNHGLQYIAS